MVFAICPFFGLYGTFVGFPDLFSSFQTQKEQEAFNSCGISTKFTRTGEVPCFDEVPCLFFVSPVEGDLFTSFVIPYTSVRMHRICDIRPVLSVPMIIL